MHVCVLFVLRNKNEGYIDNTGLSMERKWRNTKNMIPIKTHLHDPWVCTTTTTWVRLSVTSFESVHNSLNHLLYILSHFAYICMSAFTNHWHANPPIFAIYGFAMQLSSLLWSVSENPYYSWNLWDILIKFCILVYFNIVQPLWYAKRWRGVSEHHFCKSSFFFENEKAHNSCMTWYILIKFCTPINFSIIET